jgi:osmotically-inducible protein OsmY
MAEPNTTRASNDGDLARRVASFLIERHIPGAQRLQVVASDGLVTIRGTLRSFYHKQLCRHCALHVTGVATVVDDIQVA